MIGTDIQVGSVLRLPSGRFYQMVESFGNGDFAVVAVSPLSMCQVIGSEAVMTSKFMRKGSLCWTGEQWAARMLAYNADRRLAALEAFGRLKPLLDADAARVKRIDLGDANQAKGEAK